MHLLPPTASSHPEYKHNPRQASVHPADRGSLRLRPPDFSTKIKLSVPLSPYFPEKHIYVPNVPAQKKRIATGIQRFETSARLFSDKFPPTPSFPVFDNERLTRRT